MKVLIVDDSSSMRNIQGNIFKELDIETDMAENGNLAIKMLEENSEYKLILLDINMPKLNGIDTLKLIKSNDSVSHIPVVMCTSLQGKSDVSEAIKLGAQSYIIKPFDKDSFVRKVKAFF